MFREGKFLLLFLGCKDLVLQSSGTRQERSGVGFSHCTVRRALLLSLPRRVFNIPSGSLGQ